ncbi:MAG: hypothetical protein H6739_34605 [Alphaproteobacteria bacterium]|nr:hypothetical protein [Alphaproteobacteria bacterium]
MTPPTPASRHAQLTDLLTSLFTSTEELRRYIWRGEQGPKLNAELSGDKTPIAQVGHELVSILIARGKVKPELFASLRRDFPDRSEDIEQVERAWFGEVSTLRERPRVAATTGSSMRLGLVTVLALIIGVAVMLWSERREPPADELAVEASVPPASQPTPGAEEIAVDDLEDPKPPEETPSPTTAETKPDAPDTVQFTASGQGSKAVEGDVKGKTEHFKVDAEDGATGVEGNTDVKAKTVEVEARDGATGIKGDVVFSNE